MIWFEVERIPQGKWPFLTTISACLREIDEARDGPVDLKEGTDSILITGCLHAYKRAIMCRAADLACAAITCWNAHLYAGAISSSRSLLETIATFHSLLRRCELGALKSDWQTIGRLVDAYAFSTSSGPERKSKKTRTPAEPPRIGAIVTGFISETHPGDEAFWDQICDEAHPNGLRMMKTAGELRDGLFLVSRKPRDEAVLFRAVYNCLYSCCWLYSAMESDFEILLEKIRRGGELPTDHELIVMRDLVDRVVSEVTTSSQLPQE